jgi:hypothetical protein
VQLELRAEQLGERGWAERVGLELPGQGQLFVLVVMVWRRLVVV